MIDEPQVQRGDGSMTLWEHLSELRSRLFKSVLAVFVGMVVGWFVYGPLLRFMLVPFKAAYPDAALYGLGPLDAFSTRLQMSFYAGLVLAMPVLLWQLWRFITPGLYPNEKRYAIPFISGALVMFAFGAFIAYISLNPTLKFLTTIGGSDIKPIYSATSYLKLIVFMMLAFGAGFQFPVLLIALQVAGVLTPRKLSSWRRQAVVIITIVAAVITPSGDPFSMLALAIPMYLFYEMSIVIGWFILRRRRRKAARADTSGTPS